MGTLKWCPSSHKWQAYSLAISIIIPNLKGRKVDCAEKASKKERETTFWTFGTCEERGRSPSGGQAGESVQRASGGGGPGALQKRRRRSVFRGSAQDIASLPSMRGRQSFREVGQDLPSWHRRRRRKGSGRRGGTGWEWTRFGPCLRWKEGPEKRFPLGKEGRAYCWKPPFRFQVAPCQFFCFAAWSCLESFLSSEPTHFHSVVFLADSFSLAPGRAAKKERVRARKERWLTPNANERKEAIGSRSLSYIVWVDDLNATDFMNAFVMSFDSIRFA